MEQIKRFFEYNIEPVYQRLDDVTCADLNLDDLFQSVDYTYSSIGQQYLYNTMRNVPLENSVKKHHDWTLRYSQNESLQRSVEKSLSKLNDSDAYYIHTLFHEELTVASSKTVLLWRVLQFIPFVSLSLCFLFGSNLLLIITVLGFMTNLFIHYKSKQKTYLYIRSLPQLLNMLVTAKEMSRIEELKELSPDLVQLINSLSSLKKHLSLFRFDPKLESDIAMIFWFVSELFRTFFLLEPIFLNESFILINKNKSAIKQVFNFIGLVDVLQSGTKLWQNTSHCIPSFAIDKVVLEGEKIYHPLVNGCVENSFVMNEKSFVVMGSNMSGKTTFTRTVAVNILLANTLNICFAHNFKLSKFKIWTSIAIKDDLLSGESYYLAEVLRIKHIIDSTKEGLNVIFLGELFKGTNTKERIAAAAAVLLYLASNINNRLIAATHDVELIPILNINQFELKHFTDDIIDDELVFSYLLHSGMPNKRNAIKILELYDFPVDVITSARKYIEVNFDNRSWSKT